MTNIAIENAHLVRGFTHILDFIWLVVDLQPTPLKNDGVRQLERIIAYIME